MKDILLVEDHAELNHLMQMFLEKDGFTVKSVFSGEEALAYLETEKVKMIILDVVLPGMDGFAVCVGYYRRHDEFVGYALVVATFKLLDRIVGCAFAYAQRQHIIGFFHAIPTVIAVHSVIPAAYGGNLAELQLVHLDLQLLNERNAACGRYVPAVHITMYVNVVQTLAFGELD